MLTIRMQRTGRKGHAMFRVVVQDARVTPSSGKVIAYLGSYDPHTKTVTLHKDKAKQFLSHGAQPSDRVATIFEAQGIALPAWYKKPTNKTSTIRHPDKLRKNQPKTAPVEPADADTSTPEQTAEVTETKQAAEAIATT